MQILTLDQKTGFSKLKLETVDDLWHMQHIIEKGDLVTAQTTRKTTVKRGQEIHEGERKKVVLTVKVEKIERDSNVHILRVTGPIEKGPDDIQLHSYHSINIEPGMVLNLEKTKWKPQHIDRLNKARKEQEPLLVCVLDREEANFAALKASGIDWLGTIHCQKGLADEKRGDYYKQIMDTLEKHVKAGFEHIVVAGPGFERENLHKFIREKNPKIAKRILIESSASTGMRGVQEVIHKSANKIIRESRIAKETEIVEELFTRIAKDGNATYGRNEVEKTIAIGAVELLLVSQEKLELYEDFMERVEEQRGTIMIIASDHESGEKFLSIGGIAALTRFKI
ncbi:MAG: mRNA surveillance protein pelota [Nanoarchaeota archaeon]|nr:mRNA surveillance protein pelota [Nanoarchaeota archaeon]MBU1135593.1 mRNA surveillance protein pelota [Nanoarchaeota archaeon]MBU2520228.1 mRNA surveillance protein pelota [Nanoarchaeota archaeon]